MDLRILDSIDYDVTAKLLYESYAKQWGTAGFPEWHSKYLEYLDKAYIQPRNGLCVGAYDGNALIGIGFGFINDWHVADLGKISTMAVCNFGIHPTHQRKGIATAMVELLEHEAEQKNIQLIYRICNQDLNDHLAFAKAGYTKKLDNIYQMARIMGKEMIDTTAQLKGYSKGMKLLLRAVAGFPKKTKQIAFGEIREGVASDIDACVQLLNSYKDSLEMTQIWDQNEFNNVIINQNLLNKKPFAGIFNVWDVEDSIKAFVAGRFEAIIYNNGIGISAILVHAAFAPDLERKDKTSFIVSVLYKIKSTKPDTFATNLAVAHHEEKAFDKAGFNNDRSTRPLFVKILDDNLKTWFQTDWKYKNYCIPYQR
ncbi:MAG: GNAT family N-acetyltransferase [Candidatus Helarchaeota archaeon]